MTRLIHLLSFSVSLCLCGPAPFFQAQIPRSTYDKVTESFQQGKIAEAEQLLRSALRSNPNEVQALGLMGVILDAQNRYEEAERSYSQALKLAPGSAALYNNLGNHYLTRGMADRAQNSFLRVISIDPNHSNANLQLAKTSVESKRGREALQYLDHLSAPEQSATPVRLLRARALYQTGQKEQAENLLAQLEKEDSGDPRLAFSIGMIYVESERFAEAERTFTRALEAAPANFDILYNLALAATRAGHLDRAEEIFKVALGQKPEDVDCLYGLARVYAQRGQDYPATSLLLQAQRLAPTRPDIPLFLAQLTEKLGVLGDTAVAYDQYLKLRPTDDVARRERAFALARSGKVAEGLPDLEWYVQKHPKDAQGFYALGVVIALDDHGRGLEQLNHALKLDDSHAAARYVRAGLNLQDGKIPEAIADLKLILEREPNNGRALSQLGQAYLLQDQPQEACDLLKRAMDLTPQDPTLLFLYSRALRRVGRKEEAKTVQDRFSQLEPTQTGRRPRAGLFDYLSLSPSQQQAQYLAQLKTSLTANPKDAGLKLRLGKALLQQNQTAEALETFRQLRELTSDHSLLADAGATLLEFEQYQLAEELLKVAVAANPSASGPRLDLVIAISHSEDPQAALVELDKMPIDQRKGDYHLLRAQVLDSLGRPQEASLALNQGFQAAPTRADLYYQGTLFLLKHNQSEDAHRLIEQALRVVPDAPELLLTQAITLELLKKPEEAKKLLVKMQSRWPEWGLPYLIHGIILEIHLFSEEAKAQLNNAIVLGVNESAAYYYLALAIQHTTPEDTEGIRKALDQAIKLSPEDPYIRSLAGTNALTSKDYAAALEHLGAAVRLKPEMVEAHYALSATYRALGHQEKSAAELKEAERLEKENPSVDAETTSVRDLLFSVGRR
jgi:tetratricopeptide (TPR) repeat protein